MRRFRDTTIGVLSVLALFFVSVLALRAEDVDYKKKALALNDITGTAPARGQLFELLKDKAGTKKLLLEAAKLAKEKNQPFNMNASLILARAGQAFKDYDASLVFYRIYTEQVNKLQSSTKLVDAYSGMIQLLYDNKQYAECEKACREFLEQSGDDFVDTVKDAVKRRRVMAIMKMGEGDRAVRILDKMIEDDPKAWLNVELRGRLLREQEKYDEAVKVYLGLIDEVGKDDRLEKETRKELVKDFRYVLSGLYLDLNQVDKGTEQLEILLKDEPDNATYNNDLGYIWADHDMKLDESEKMIRKAIELDRKARKQEADLLPEEDKDNPAYLDSLGWVLFKKKQYKEAKPFLVEAVKDTDLIDVTLYDHLGDVHWALGEKKEAMEIWKKALELPTGTKRDKVKKEEIAKKLKMGE